MVKIKKVFVISVLSLVGVLFAGKSCFAVNISDVTKKWVFTGYQKCIADGQMNTVLNTADHRSGSVAKDVFNNGGSVVLPSYGFGGVGTGSNTCSSLFLGDGAFSGGTSVVSMGGLSNSVDWNNASDTRNFLENVGYTYKKSEGEDYLVINAIKQSCNEQGGNCQNSETSSVRIYKEGADGYRAETGFAGSNQWFNEIKIAAYDTSRELKITINQTNCDWGNNIHEFSIAYDNDIRAFASKIADKIFGVTPTCKRYVTGGRPPRKTYRGIVKYGFSNGGITSIGEDGVYNFDRNNKAVVEKSIKSLSGLSMSDLILNENERYALYLHYLNGAVKEESGTIDCSSTSDPGSNFIKVKLKKSDDFGDCYVSFSGKDPASISVNDLSSAGSGQFPTFRVINIKNVIDWFNTVDTSKLTDVDVINDFDPMSANGGENDCLGADLNGQGWWVCPTLTNATYTASFFDNLTQDLLSVDNEYYNNNSPTHSVWEVMRNIANILMIILLLVIIISQLTGYGINNYGIKKMLPRFVVMAILINLSFVICGIAVDLSNILGVGLRNMFGAMGVGIQNGGSINFISYIVGGLLGAVGIGGAVSGTVVTVVGLSAAGVTAAPVIAIVVLLALIPVIIAVILFFAMLGARMMIVIGCVALSPVAFALFILPNTQNVFKKWWGLMKAALIMFPLCGAVSGISTLIKGIVVETGEISVGMGVVCLLAPFLPFFMMPSLLKSAISLLGTAGAALTSIGDRAKSGAKSGIDAVQRSERFQNASKFATDKAKMARAESTMNKLGGRNDLSSFQRQRLLNAQRIKTGMESEDLKAYQAQYSMYERNKLSEEASGASSWINEEGGEQRMMALLGQMESLGMEDDIFAMLENTNVSGKSRVMSALAGSNNKVLKAYGKSGAGVSFGDFMRGHGANGEELYRDASGNITNAATSVDGNGNTVYNSRVSMASYAAKKGADFVNGIDDKALGIIKKYDNTNQGHILSTNQLVQSATALNDESSLAHVNEMLKNRGSEINFSGSQFSNLKKSTIDAITDSRSASPETVEAAKIAMENAIQAAVQDSQLASRIDPSILDGALGKLSNEALSRIAGTDQEAASNAIRGAARNKLHP